LEDREVPIKQRSILVHRILLILFMVVLVGGAAVLIIRHNEVIDSIRLRGYKAPGNISALASQTTMTPYAKRLLYVNYPAVEGKTAFNKHCPNASREIAVLGCYLGDRRGIYIYDVTDSRLNGIEQVTTAHEMLHQAYDRLSSSEKKRIDKLLEDYYATVTDQSLKDKMAAYKQIEPNDLNNEMHSVFGTEVSNLPAELETYYKQYFTDRQKVLAYFEQSHQAYTQAQQQIAAYDAQLATMKAQIDQSKAALTVNESAIEVERVKLDAYLNANKIAAYNAAVPGFNASIEEYKQQVAAANSLIDQYNQTIEKRNAIAVEQQQLISAENSQSDSEANTK
jgi:hypothetical protein